MKEIEREKQEILCSLSREQESVRSMTEQLETQTAAHNQLQENHALLTENNSTLKQSLITIRDAVTVDEAKIREVSALCPSLQFWGLVQR